LYLHHTKTQIGKYQIGTTNPSSVLNYIFYNMFLDIRIYQYNINDIDEIMHMTLMIGICSACFTVGINIQYIAISWVVRLILNFICQFVFYGQEIDCMYQLVNCCVI